MPTNAPLAEQLEYLMSEIGLSPDVALMLVQHQQGTMASAPEPGAVDQSRLSAGLGAESGDVIDDILRELRDQLPAAPAMEQPVEQPAPETAEYELLSDYFRSVTQ